MHYGNKACSCHFSERFIVVFRIGLNSAETLACRAPTIAERSRLSQNPGVWGAIHHALGWPRTQKHTEGGENDALITPLSVTGTVEELDLELASTLISYVGAHLQIKSTLEKSKAEMDAASRMAQVEARTRSKTAGTKEHPKAEVTQPVAAGKLAEPVKPASPTTANRFDLPTTATIPAAPPDEPCSFSLSHLCAMCEGHIASVALGRLSEEEIK